MASFVFSIVTTFQIWKHLKLKETTGNEPSSLPSSAESDNDLLDMYHIIEKFKDHPSVTSKRGRHF